MCSMSLASSSLLGAERREETHVAELSIATVGDMTGRVVAVVWGCALTDTPPSLISLGFFEVPDEDDDNFAVPGVEGGD